MFTKWTKSKFKWETVCTTWGKYFIILHIMLRILKFIGIQKKAIIQIIIMWFYYLQRVPIIIVNPE
jgi:hypothetical protein